MLFYVNKDSLEIDFKVVIFEYAFANQGNFLSV